MVEEFTIHSDIGPSASIAGSRFSHEPESIEDIDLAIAEAELRVLKAKREIVMKSKASSEASLSSLRAQKKRIRSTGASSVGGAIHTAASSSGLVPTMAPMGAEVVAVSDLIGVAGEVIHVPDADRPTFPNIWLDGLMFASSGIAGACGPMKVDRSRSCWCWSCRR